MAQSASASEFLKNPRNQVILGASVVVILIIVVVVMAMAGGSSSDTSGAAATTPDAGAGIVAPGGDPGLGLNTGDAGAGGPMTGGDMGMAGPGGADPMASGGTGGATGGGEKKRIPVAQIPNRTDPFQYNSELQRVYAEMVTLDDLDTQVSPSHVEQWWELYKPPMGPRAGDNPNEVEPQLPVPPMRVAGIHSGSVVAAMLEVGGQILPTLAVPGSTLQIGGEQFRVERVDREGVVLSRKVEGFVKRQRIEVGLESSTTGFGGIGGSGGMGVPSGPGMPGGSGSGGFFGPGGGGATGGGKRGEI